jgi:phosphomannomutase/phosphoglucomutase
MTNFRTLELITSTIGKVKQHPLTLVSLVLIICGFTWFSFFLYQNIVDKTKQDLAHAQATNYAQQQLTTTNTYLQQRQQQLQALSEKKLFVSALTSGNSKKIEQMESLMADWVDGLTHGYLLSPTDTRLDKTHNFAGQQIVLNILAGEKPSPVAAYINGSWQLTFGYPIADNDEDNIQGVMLIMLGTETLSSLLKNVDNSLGTTELFQQLPDIQGKAVIALKNNNQAIETVHMKTRIPHWEIRFTGSSVLLNQAEPSYREFTIILSAVIALMLLLLYLVIRFTLHYHKDKTPRVKSKDKGKHDVVNQSNEAAVDETRASYLQVLPSSSKSSEDDSSQTEEPDPPIKNDPQAPESKNETTADENAQEKLLFPSVVFRDYDIRGLANTQLTTEFAHRLGKVLATRAQSLGEHSLIVGCDGRKSSPELTEALEQGILSTGCHVIHLGAVPTPLLNFAVHQLTETDCGVMVTASHNPAEYNGFKMFFKRHALCGDEIFSLRSELSQNFPMVNSGELEVLDLSNDYVESIANDMVPADNLKVVLDAGNGIAGKQGCLVLEAIGCNVIPLYCDVDGDFPNHPPDTSVAANLADLIACVKESKADLGIALDGDGDRVVAVSASGKIIWPDELLMIFARDVVSRHPGADVVFDVKSTNRLNSLISSYGGRPVMWKTGHSHMYNKILACDAPVGGEYSGHIFFHDRWHGFDDGIYAAARLVEIMAIREQGLDDMMDSFESRHATPEIKVTIAEEDKFTFMDKLLAEHTFNEGKISTIDGLRLELPEAWGLVRASNTSPALTLRFEANSREALTNIQSLFKQQLEKIESKVTFEVYR